MLPVRLVRRLCAHDAPWTGARASNVGTTPSPGLRIFRRNMLPGWTHCPTISKTAQRPRHCGRLSISIFQSSTRSNRLEALDVIEQRDGPSGMGRDDARGGGWRSPVAIGSAR